jgi:hypothetical protein
MKAKEITVVGVHNERENEYKGTVEYLASAVFGYTLQRGNSWNKKINRYPTTAKGLVDALNKSAHECGRYNDYYLLR